MNLSTKFSSIFFNRINLIILTAIIIALINPFEFSRDLKKNDYHYSTTNISSENTWARVDSINPSTFSVHPGEIKPSILQLDISNNLELNLDFEINLPEEALNNPKSGIVLVKITNENGKEQSLIVDRNYNKTISTEGKKITIEINKGEETWSDTTIIRLSINTKNGIIKKTTLFITLSLFLWFFPFLTNRFASKKLKNKLHEIQPELFGLIIYSSLILLFLPTRYFAGDMGCWRTWGIYIFQNGVTQVYDTTCNYHPLFLYCINFFTYLMGSEATIAENINYIKIFPFLFDLIPVLILLIYKKKLNPNNTNYYWLLLNIGYLYNSIFWGQVDSIYTSFALLSIIFVLEKRLTLGLILLTLALSTKLQAIIFLPIVALLIFRHREVGFLKILTSIVYALAFQTLILSPFLLEGKWDDLVATVKDAVDHCPLVSANAFNFWYLVMDSDPMKMGDNKIILGLSYKNWGSALFLLFSAITLLPLFSHSIFRKSKINLYELTFLSLGVISLVFFYFNTQMHERYSHPAIIFFFFYALQSRRKDLFLITSCAYFLNLEKVLEYFEIHHHTLIFNPRFISVLFAIPLIIGIIRLYKNFELKSIYKNFILRKTNQSQ